jgi:hypothetical protein
MFWKFVAVNIVVRHFALNFQDSFLLCADFGSGGPHQAAAAVIPQ